MKDTLEQWFFGFWVKKYRVSLLVTLLLVLYWTFSLYMIPKESSPDIKFWIIGVTTVYTWVDPISIDDLITSKIEKEVKDLEWVKKVTSTSRLWVSSVVIELDTWVDTRNLLTDIKDQVDKVSLPSEAEDPVVTEISTENELLFSFYMFAQDSTTTIYDLYDKAVVMKNYLQWRSGITTVNITPNPEYEILVALDKTKIENLWLSIAQVSNIIRNYNKNTPIWNYEVGDKTYDFRFEWEYFDFEDIKKTPIILWWGTIITLDQIAEVKRDYLSKNIENQVGFYNEAWLPYVQLTVNKKPKISIFATSKSAKTLIEERLAQWDMQGVGFEYVMDLAETIMKDYKDLADSWVKTLLLVFVLLFIFLWLKEWVIATILIPLAFFITFIVLDIMWLSLNFLTNFSLLLTLWIALDTIIVIVEWSSEKMKIWYTPRTAVLLTVKEFKAPLIAGTMTTLVVFLPMMLLPGIMWKFLAYIPITVFITLLAALVLSLTINSALFMKLNKDKKYYIKSDSSDSVKTQEEIELLKEEREWKYEKSSQTWGIRYAFFGFLENTYYSILLKNIQRWWFRFFVILTPFVLLILSFMFISPKLGFVLFPSWDNPNINITIQWAVWDTTQVMKQHTDFINKWLMTIPEIKIFSISVDGRTLNVWVELFDKRYRDENMLRNSFEVEKEISQKLQTLTSKWLVVETKVESWWPPSWSPVGIKLIAMSNKEFQTLVDVANEFEKFLATIEGTKNVKNSSTPTPGQFIFRLDNQKLAQLWLTPSDILNEIYFMSAGIKAGSIKWDFDDHDIVVKISDFEDKTLTPSDIMDMELMTKAWKLKIGNVATYEFLPAISTISRENGNIVISVESDLEEWFIPTQVQPKFLEFAQNFNYPDNISFASGWEASENAELIASTISSFFIAIFLIFGILVFQFNSYSQPAIILYSIVLALLWVNIWLFLTGNPYSMPFAIWFIALTWIVVNNAIILIDKINSNIEKWVDGVEAVAESWKSRLRPILLTTLTTIFWILPLALQDEFWAGLGFTVIFGLMFASFMTLFVTPSLYYQLFLTPQKRFFIIRFILWILWIIKNTIKKS